MDDMRLLDYDDIITPDAFVRPLVFTPEEFDAVTVIVDAPNPYGGAPTNHLLWCPVRDILGSYWNGKRVGEYVKKVEVFDPDSNGLREVDSHEFAVNVPRQRQIGGYGEHGRMLRSIAGEW